MDGLALALSDVPLELMEQYPLSRLVHDRGGEREVRFLRHVPQPMLPIRIDGQLRIVPWGCRSGELPRSGLTWRKTVESGEWIVHHALEVEIPAMAGWQNGVWFRIRQGVQGLLAETGGVTAAYMVVEPSTYYYKIMTRSERMPVLIGERI